MPNLTWMERNVVDELVGALLTAASLCEHHPHAAETIRAETARQLGAAERDLVQRLHDRLNGAATL